MSDWPEWLSSIGGIVLGVSGIGLVCVLVGSCVQDYASATPQIVEVMITDKNYYPPHTNTNCSTDNHGNMSCSTTYVGPSWSVEYADESRHAFGVSQGVYEVVRIGERRVLRYDLGGGYWRARYNEQFSLSATAEASR